MFDKQDIAQAVELRRFFHAHPELKFEEHQTAARVADELRRLGYEVTEGVVGTGVIGMLDTGRPGKTIALRADMDALPIVEQTGAEYSSTKPGLMHACGHDGHTATLLLAAMQITKLRDRLNGRIKLIFQPGEEGGLGAEKMVQAGVLDDVDAIFGYHNRPGFPEGKVFVKANAAMGGCDQFELTLHGRSGHAARPDQSVDPIYIGTLVVQALQGIVARQSYRPCKASSRVRYPPWKQVWSPSHSFMRARQVTSFRPRPSWSSTRATARRACARSSLPRSKRSSPASARLTVQA